MIGRGDSRMVFQAVLNAALLTTVKARARRELICVARKIQFRLSLHKYMPYEAIPQSLFQSKLLTRPNNATLSVAA